MYVSFSLSFCYYCVLGWYSWFCLCPGVICMCVSSLCVGVVVVTLVLVLVLSSMERSLAAMDSLYDDGHCHSNDGVSN